MPNPAAVEALGFAPELIAAVASAAAGGAAWVALRQRREANRALDELNRLTSVDSITNLPNRAQLSGWLTDLNAPLSKSTRVGLILIDLHRFGRVNDMFGHEVGDKLMRAVAERITSVLGPTDRLARFGGDEFAMVCQSITGTTGLDKHARRLIRLIEQPFSVAGQSIRISASIGAVLSEETSTEPESLLRQADVARYQATSLGPGQVVLYERSMSSALTPANAEQKVRDALLQREFRLQYQPVIDLSSGRVIGAEALLRWVSPDRGTLGPDEFIPILEETGLIVPVGTWVLQEACRQAAHLKMLMPSQAPAITINVSARQLNQEGFADLVADALSSSGASESQIHLEITEGALMHDVGTAWAILRQTKALGVKLALDDFGTGYSSLSYVRQFSLDMLKIDKSFIDGIDTSPEDRAIVEHVIGLADALGMTTVAEGVERPEQLVWLRRLGCQMAQGFALSRPLNPDDLLALMLRRHDTPFRIDDALGDGALTDIDITGNSPQNADDFLRELTGETDISATPLAPTLTPPPSTNRSRRSLSTSATPAPADISTPPIVFSNPALADLSSAMINTSAPTERMPSGQLGEPGEPGEPSSQAVASGESESVPKPNRNGDGAPQARRGLPRFREYQVSQDDT